MKARPQLLLFLLIAFALLFAQQGAALHALSHLAEPTSQSQQEKQLPHSPVCDKCVVYAEVGGAVAAAGLSLAAVCVLAVFLAASVLLRLSRTSLPYLSRAPPALA